MTAGSLYQKRKAIETTLDKLTRQLAKGMFLQTEEIDEWSEALTIAQRYDFYDLQDKLGDLIAKPRHDAGKSVSKPGTVRKAMATDAFHALFIGGLV
jgi:hypothetical protein